MRCKSWVPLGRIDFFKIRSHGISDPNAAPLFRLCYFHSCFARVKFDGLAPGLLQQMGVGCDLQVGMPQELLHHLWILRIQQGCKRAAEPVICHSLATFAAFTAGLPYRRQSPV